MNETSILCETCGYPLEGLSPGAACPECGRDAASSLPGARPGSPWQRSRGLASWARTGLRAAIAPSALMREVRIAGRGWDLVALNLLASAMLIAAPWTGVFVGDPLRGISRIDSLGTLARVLAVIGLQVLGVFAVLWLLTWVEVVGIRFFSRRRGWRLTRAGSWQVCAHASYGWLISGVLPLLLLSTLFGVQRVFGVAPGGSFSLAPIWNTRLAWYEVVGVGGPLVGYFVGMLAFEMLVYRGVRQCRYAATEAAPGSNPVN